MNIHEIKPSRTFVHRGLLVDEYILDQGHSLCLFLMARSKRGFSIHNFNPKFRVKVIWIKHQDEYPDTDRIPMFYTDADPDNEDSLTSARRSVGKAFAEHYECYGTGPVPQIDPAHN